MISAIDIYGGLLFLMLAWHAIADGPLQSADLSAAKRGPGRGQYLLLHGLIHGGGVAVVTGFWWLGAAETVMHAFIDEQKGRGRITHLTDQALHALCKIVWAAVALAMLR